MKKIGLWKSGLLVIGMSAFIVAIFLYLIARRRKKEESENGVQKKILRIEMSNNSERVRNAELFERKKLTSFS